MTPWVSEEDPMKRTACQYVLVYHACDMKAKFLYLPLMWPKLLISKPSPSFPH
jgi:hypothetical protein